MIKTSWKANQLHFLPRKDGRVNTQFHFHFPTNQLKPTLKWLGKIRGCHRLCYRDDRFCGDPWKVSSPFPFQSHPSFLYKWTLDKHNDFLVSPHSKASISVSHFKKIPFSSHAVLVTEASQGGYQWQGERHYIYFFFHRVWTEHHKNHFIIRFK